MLLGTIPVVDAAAADNVSLRLRGRVFGVVMTRGIVVGALSPYVMGLIHDIVGGQEIAYLLLGISALAGAAMVFTIPPQGPHTP